jgi:tRNA dimethylallyltransferase
MDADGSDKLSDAPTRAAFRERGIAATRQLAKRQITWLRSMPQRTTIVADAPDAIERLLTGVDQALSAR